MSDEETMRGLIEKARGDLSRAVYVLETTPRPTTVCGSHDAIFAVQRATANALDTILLMFSGRMVAAVEDGAKITWTWFVKTFGRTLIWAAVALIAYVTTIGKLDVFVDAVQRIRGAGNYSQYEPSN